LRPSQALEAAAYATLAQTRLGLLTAGFAALGKAMVVGDPAHGWFWFPPKEIWKSWALQALDQQVSKLKARKFPTITLWIGRLFR
jgi:hypothetical protein